MDPDTFQQLPISMDAQTKILSTSLNDYKLQEELAALNQLHKAVQQSGAPNQVPQAPVPVDPKRSAQIAKLREAGNASFKKSQYQDAVRMYSLAIDMALGRPVWEPVGLCRDEVVALLSNRAQAHMSANNWPEAAIDAQTAVELRKTNNSKAWWRRGKCLLEMGRLDEAREWVTEGLDFEAEPELQALKAEIDGRLKPS